MSKGPAKEKIMDQSTCKNKAKAEKEGTDSRTQPFHFNFFVFFKQKYTHRLTDTINVLQTSKEKPSIGPNPTPQSNPNPSPESQGHRSCKVLQGEASNRTQTHHRFQGSSSKVCSLTHALFVYNALFFYLFWLKKS
ncbi:hypothetical protein HYC85_013840 [Camellia sinensis]|uniref:Uncharacterized protein n=1 Tax=Camellia sinensis TaxID=4442 RepID=A0A7J7H4J7_CAMSI|nr:hypothetical protein HYC85_013840 [Camellia sinensis]